MYSPNGNQRNPFRKTYYDQAVIDQVKQGNDLVEVVGDYTELKPSGDELVGLCPAHKEKTPSFYVNPAKQVYLCRGCQAGGDVLDFVMTVDHISFPEALRRLAARGGVELRPPTAADLRQRARQEAAEAEGRSVLTYRREMLNALLSARAGWIAREDRCWRILLTRPAGSATCRRAIILLRAYNAMIDDLEARIDTIRRARPENLITSFRKSGWQSAQPRDRHGENEQLTAALVAMVSLAQQHDGDVPHIPLEVSDQRYVSPREATRIDKLVTSAMAQMTVANKLVGVGQ